MRYLVFFFTFFTFFYRGRELWYVSPPTTFLTALATGGLKKLYDDIRAKQCSKSGRYALISVLCHLLPLI